MNGYVQDVIMLLGDSLTQGASDAGGFAQKLSYAYNRKLDVVNRGLSGYNTKWAIPVFTQCLARRTGTHADGLFPKVQLLTLWFGANDACLEHSPQHVPLADFAENLDTLVRAVRAPGSAHYAPWTRVVLLTPPPVNTRQRGADLAARDPPRACDRDFEVTRQYAQAVREVGARHRLPVVDVWTMLWEGCGKEEAKLDKYLSDGLHTNAEAHALIYDGLMKVIAERWPEFSPERLPMVFPPWDQVITNPSLEKRVLFKEASLRD
ncbi:SGNH hydrolase [Phanerochaete sordida]|uniref:SGNH hydrolase n=1 Tax=Phanerochaete sordida TaxID=48140 RepID=A0A9P3GNW1_9APHY|nr:SGNH hydrolase [Phanerochaete sordida]